MTRLSNVRTVRPLRWVARAILLVLVLGIGLTASAATPGVVVTKWVSKPDVVPGETVTYVIVVRATRDVTVTVTDMLPFGVTFAGGLVPASASYADGQVTWSGEIKACDTVNISFRVTVEEPSTLGPLPIVNTACADDGTDEVCSSVLICSRCRKIYLPLIARRD
jgi:uncharacterized repeat protein (TIGR01451 family)